MATNFVKTFAQALSKLTKGQFTRQPVQSPFGWHVIYLEDVRNVKFPDFEQVKDRIQDVVQQQEIQKIFTDLRKKATIK